MGDLMISFFVILVTGGVIIAIFVLVGKKKKQRLEQVRLLAIEKAWQFEEIKTVHESGFVLRGRDWTYDSIISTSDRPSESGSSTVSYNNRWFSSSLVSVHGLVLIGPKLPEVNLGGLGEMLFQKALQLMLGNEAGEAAGIAPVEIWRTSLRDRFSVYARDLDAAQKVIQYNAENTLLRWQHKELPVIKISSKGIEIGLKEGRADAPELIREIVTLGEAFLEG